MRIRTTAVVVLTLALVLGMITSAWAWPQIEREQIADDAIGEEQIDWGSGSEQVAADDVPVDSSGWSNIVGVTVQLALDWLDSNWASPLWQRNGTVLSPATADDSVTITSATDEDLLILEYTGGDTSGSTMELYHNSATPANNDRVGALIFQGEDSNSDIEDFVRITAYAEDVTHDAEDGGLAIEVQVGSTLQNVWDCWPDKVLLNGDGVDIDFVVEGENDANLLHVDAANDRIGISDATPDALLDIDGDGTTTGETLRITRDLASASTDSPVVEIHQDNAGDDQHALHVVQDGAGAGAVYIESANKAALIAISSGDHGIVGATSSGSHAHYGLYTAHRTHVGDYADFDEEAAPVNAVTGDLRTYALTDSRLYARDDSSNVHDLTVAHKQSQPGKDLACEVEGDTWLADATSAASHKAPVTAGSGYDYNFTNHEQITGSGKWSWEFSRDGEIYIQSQMATGFEVPWWGNTVTVSARIKIDVAGIATVADEVRLYVTRTDSAQSSSQTVAVPADNTWVVVEHTFDISAWTADQATDDALRVGIEVVGPDVAEREVGSLDVYIELIAVEQWAV